LVRRVLSLLSLRCFLSVLQLTFVFASECI
jgi:hypothetical protein